MFGGKEKLGSLKEGGKGNVRDSESAVAWGKRGREGEREGVVKPPTKESSDAMNIREKQNPKDRENGTS